MDSTYQALIASDRVSPQTRAVLEARIDLTRDGRRADLFSEDEFNTLDALAKCIVPQQPVEEGDAINLAARLEEKLADGPGDGWRYASLPSDQAAYRAGLAAVEEFARDRFEASFGRLAAEQQTVLLTMIAAEELTSPKIALKRWFEDLRADLTQIYVAHPDTLARMGYSGIADDPDGFVQLGMGKVEAWEPRAK